MLFQEFLLLGHSRRAGRSRSDLAQLFQVAHRTF
jgi:hypothetical protein